MYLIVNLAMSLNRKHVAIAAFLVIVPTGLFFSLWLPSALQGSSVIVRETIEANPVTWGIERPGGSVRLSEEVLSTFSSSEISSLFNLSICNFYDSYGMMGSQDVFGLIITISGQVSSGFVKSAYVVIDEDYGPSYVDWFGNWFSEVGRVKLENFYLKDYADFAELAGTGNQKAFVELETAGTPVEATFQGFGFWALYSPKNYTHLMNARLEMVYYNGTVFKKVVHSIEMRTYSDNNNRPETAEEIQSGTYSMKYIGTYDVRDYYKIHFTEGQQVTIFVNMTSIEVAGFELDLLDPDLTPRASNQTNSLSKTLELTADFTGSWYIKVNAIAGYGFYLLKVSS